MNKLHETFRFTLLAEFALADEVISDATYQKIMNEARESLGSTFSDAAAEYLTANKWSEEDMQEAALNPSKFIGLWQDIVFTLPSF